jgi:ribosomal protein L11 methyltransferase
MNDFYLEISCSEEREEEIAARLFLTKSRGSTTDAVSAGTVLVTAYFDSAADRDEAAAMFDDADGVRAGEREPVDWLEHYEQQLHPIFIGDSFVVAPDAKLIPPETRRHALVIPQEQAFGTGSHETTSLCIELLETLPLFGARGLDVGAGSGILALAMLRLGAAKAIAFDNDADAYAALRENRARNGVEPPRMPLFIGSIEALRGGAFDVVTMNIIPEVILPLLGEVVARVRGTLILSGILTTRRDDVVAACPLPLLAERERGEWWAGAFSASATPPRSRAPSPAAAPPSDRTAGSASARRPGRRSAGRGSRRPGNSASGC